ncbi:uncharacterized protein GGS22DRAFT_181603 [Annulohypoxylon maeteangense]|uniref:uncharacterized protein n=1 Tax=Annulohypoxylon maeteangense TaxID=1927788 RepID=UPI002007CEDE|nr:uncharacterized protein GGS22DRAFT_181603 [Annulohypoxylon maeteangense]KAI0881433.1 hypothetical protein GGS22DRAFT_181603 [Annulohypoxylon maeteangense]
MASRDGQSKRGRHGSSPEHQSEAGPSQRRRRIERQRMPEDERKARQQRRYRLREQREKKDEDSEATGSNLPAVAEEQRASSNEPAKIESTEIEVIEELKPWETLVIGCDFGYNLSYIEEKDREIEQHRYIVKYHQEHSPDEVAHKQKVLDKLIKERSEMEDNEENNMPKNQREEKNRIGERLEALNWALDTCQCEAEEANIQAAIQGYHSGDIPYSDNFTLIYAGHIADVCPTYRSFCVDRKERLDRYYARFGPGWLWYEPPLSEGNDGVLAKKGLCLKRARPPSAYDIGNYPVYQSFTIDRTKVSREDEKTYERMPEKERPPKNPRSTVHLKTILDSGATFPLLPVSDFQHLDIDLRWLAAQGVLKVATATEIIIRRFFEFRVSVCTEKGESIVGKGDDAVYPDEERVLGGPCPVVLDHAKKVKGKWTDRLSGMMPFEYCYISSAPTGMEFWLGEDRRDVLGSRRMPALARYDPETEIYVDTPKDFEALQGRAQTPDEVIFKHHFREKQATTFVDRDWPRMRGRCELSATELSPNDQGWYEPKETRKCILEPRVGSVWKSSWTPAWRYDLLSKAELENPRYQSINQDPLASSRGWV